MPTLATANFGKAALGFIESPALSITAVLADSAVKSGPWSARSTGSGRAEPRGRQSDQADCGHLRFIFPWHSRCIFVRRT